MVDCSELERIRDEIRRIPHAVPDGPVCLQQYLTAPRRIVWLLREVNSNEDGWSLSEFLRDCIHKPESRWYSTFGLVAKVSQALLQCPSPAVLPTLDNATGSLQRIAVVNIKKTGGGARSNWASLRRHAEEFGPLLARQLAALDAEVLVAAGTSDILPDLSRFAVRVANTYHPSQRRLSHSAMYESIVKQLGDVVR